MGKISYTLKVVGCLGDVGAYGFNYYYSIGLTVPQNVAINRSGTNFTLNWTAVPGAVYYLIEYSVNPYTGYAPIAGTSNTSVTVSSNEPYIFFRVRASDTPTP